MELFTASNPADLAVPYAENLVMGGFLDSFSAASLHEQRQIAQLEQEASILKMLGETYFVQSHRSLAIAASFEDTDENVAGYDFKEGLDFRGKLITYSTLRVGRVIGAGAVRALCLTFDEVTLLPY